MSASEVEVVFVVDDDGSDGEGWCCRMPQPPSVGHEVVWGNPADGYTAWRVESVHWQMRRRPDGWTALELVTVTVSRVERGAP